MIKYDQNLKLVNSYLFPHPFELSSLNGVNGFVINGVYRNDNSGYSVSRAGDVNADGIDDIIIGAYQANYFTGQSYVVYGNQEGFPTTFNLSDLNRTKGFIVNGISQDDNSGYSVSGAGDINFDGIADLIIGAPLANNNAGQSYVAFGCKYRFHESINLSNLNGKNGFAINGTVSDDRSSYSVSEIGDINADGIVDIIIGSTGQSDRASYVVFGSQDGFPESFNLANLNGMNGFTVYSAMITGGAAYSVSGAGDINADSIADLIIGAPQDDSYGKCYVVFGSQELFPAALDLAELNGMNGFIVEGVGERIGNSVSDVGDINADGIDDIIIGSYGTNNAGKSYVIFGSHNEFSAVFELSSLNGTNGFTINGISQGDLAGHSVSGAGDMNADGIDDIIIGAYAATHGEDYQAGQSYVVFGSQDRFPATFYLSNLNGTNGFAIYGINRGDYSGYSVSGAGDINADGVDDIIIGAYGVNDEAGQSYVIFGQRQLVEEQQVDVILE